MPNVELKIILSAIDRATAPLKDASASLNKFSTTFNQDLMRGLDRGQASMKDFGRALLEAGDQAGLGASQISRMAAATGIYSDQQILAAQSTANVAAKAQELSEAVKRGEMTTREAGQAFREYAQSQTVAAQSTQAFADASMKLGLAFSAITAAESALLFSSTKLAARVETLGVVTSVMGKNVGMTEIQVRSLEKAITEKGITLQAARQAIARMIQAEIDLSKATELARLAQDAAVISGENSSETFDKLTYVIASGNILMARRMGLLVDFDAAYKREAEALGKSTEALTEHEKLIIRTNEVLSKSVNIAGAYEAAMETAGKKVTSLSRHVEESKRILGETWLPVYADAIDLITRSLERWEDLSAEQQNAASKALGYATAITAAEAATFLSIATFLKAAEAAAFLAKSLGLANVAALGLIALPVAAWTVAAVKFYELSRTIEQGSKVADDAWTQFIENAAKETGSATQTADAYLEKLKEIQRIIQAGGFAGLFVDTGDSVQNLKTLEGVLRTTAKSFDEYQSNLERVAQAESLRVDAEGNLVRVMATRGGATTQVVESEIALSQAEWEAYRVIQILGDTRRENIDILKRYQETLIETGLSEDELARAFQDLQLLVSGQLGQAIEDYTQKQDALVVKMAELGAKIAEVEGMPVSERQQQELFKLQQELENTNAAFDENAAQHTRDTQQIIFNMFLQRIAQAELTGDVQQAAYQMAYDMALSWGLIDQATYKALQSMDRGLGLLAQGNIKGAQSEIARLHNMALNAQGDYFITFHVNTIQGSLTSPTGAERKPKAGQTTRTVFTPPTITTPPGGFFPSGFGGAGAKEPEVKQKSPLEILMDTANAVSRLGSSAADILQKRTIDPLKKKLEAIDALLKPGHADLYAMEHMAELARDRAEAAEKVAEAEEKILKLQEAQQNLDLIKNQMDLLNIVKENKLNAAEILGDIDWSDWGSVIDATTRAINELVDKAKAELGVASPSKVFAQIGKEIDAGLAKGLWDNVRVVDVALDAVLGSMVNRHSIQAMSQANANHEAPVINIYATVANDIDIEKLAVRVGEVWMRRSGG